MPLNKLIKLKILTLNCWAIPIKYASKLRVERIDAIGDEIAKGEYDIVLLQEIWSPGDYKTLCDKVSPKMMHTHYWYSGVVGSGLCLFSKFPIIETFSHAYSVNGYAHRFLHGDWYGGKLVGLAKVAIDDFLIHVYTTHTHAEYCDSDHFRDSYPAHRTLQAYELSEFVRLTGSGCDAVLVCGDLNLQPHELGYKIIRSNAALEDSWTSQREGEKNIFTCSRIDNSFTTPNNIAKCLDYVLFRNNTGTEVTCTNCSLAMGKVPEKEYNYSDHEGVASELIIKRNVTAMGPDRKLPELEQCLPEAVTILDDGIRSIKSARFFYLALVVLSLTLLIFSSNMIFPFGLDWFLVLVRFALLLLAAGSLWMVTIVDVQNHNGLLAARININRLLNR